MTFELTMPDEEAGMFRHHLEKAVVLLEYGSGGSTLEAARRPGRLVISVESDRDWAITLQHHIDAADLPSPAFVQHVDIGPTGAWGRPLDPSQWKRFHRYSMGIWEEPYFRHPDLVLIDGRFRPACLATTILRIKRPVTVLFDDYRNRESYHAVEQFAKPVEMAGRMARFELVPRTARTDEIAPLLASFFEATYATNRVIYRS